MLYNLDSYLVTVASTLHWQTPYNITPRIWFAAGTLFRVAKSGSKHASNANVKNVYDIKKSKLMIRDKKCVLILSDFNQTWILSIDANKIHPAGANFFRTDRASEQIIHGRSGSVKVEHVRGMRRQIQKVR